MTPQADYQRLLDDVIHDATPVEPFYRDSLNATLRLVRHRRRQRRILKAMMLATCVFVSTLWIFKHLKSGPVSYVHTETASALAKKTARTNGQEFTQFVATQTFKNVKTTVPDNTMTFVTTHSFNPNVRILDDATLLAFAAPHPVALLRISPGLQTLIFMEDSSRLEGPH